MPSEPADWSSNTSGAVYFTANQQAMLCAPFRELAQLCALRSMTEIHRERDQLVTLGQKHKFELQVGMVGFAGLALLLVGVSAWRLARGLARPLADVTNSVREVAVGELNKPLLHRERLDEIGAIANALYTMREALKEREALHDGARKAELARERQLKIERAIAEFEASMRGVMNNVRTTIEHLDVTSQELTQASQTANSDAISAVDATDATSHSTKTINAATADLSQSISGVSQRLKTTTEMMVQCDTLAQDAQASVTVLDDAANQIVDVIRLINDVATHTNLLALNATIEAARAGEAGRGFSVVAAEVKQLAGQTAAATKSITTRIDGMRKATTDAVDNIRKIAGMLGNALAIVTEISQAMEVQDETSREIARSMCDTSQAVEMVQSSVSSLKRTVDQSAKASDVFVQATLDIVNDSAVIDETIKTFLRETSLQETSRQEAGGELAA